MGPPTTPQRFPVAGVFAGWFFNNTTYETFCSPHDSGWPLGIAGTLRPLCSIVDCTSPTTQKMIWFGATGRSFLTRICRSTKLHQNRGSFPAVIPKLCIHKPEDNSKCIGKCRIKLTFRFSLPLFFPAISRRLSLRQYHILLSDEKLC